MGRSELFHKLPFCWDFHTRQSLGFTENWSRKTGKWCLATAVWRKMVCKTLDVGGESSGGSEMRERQRRACRVINGF